MAKEKFLYELDELVEAVEELNALLFDDEHAIDTGQKEGALQQAVVDASVLLAPTDKVSKDTLKMIKALKDSGIEPTPEEEEKKEDPEPEEDEPKAKGKVKKEEPVEDVVDLDDLFDQVDKAKERKELKAVIKDNDFFAEKKEDLLDIEDFKPMQEAMLDMIEEAQEAAKKSKKATKKEEEPVKTSKKEEKKEKEPSAKAGKKPDFGKRGDESFPAMAVRLLKEEASEKEILAAYTKAYKERKDITDEKFIKGRVAIYLKLAKEGTDKKK